MMKLKEHFQKKKKPAEPAQVPKKRGHRVLILVGLILAALAATGVGAYIYIENKIFQGYEVISSADREDVATARFTEFRGKVLKYSKDGASYLNSDNSVIWSQAYEMQSPIVDICGDYVAIGDKDGSKIYVMNLKGPQGQINTTMAIQQISVSGKGNVYAVLEDNSVNYMNYYDKDGNLLAEALAQMDQTGYPFDVDLSPDGNRLAVSYISVNEGVMKTNLAFYNFGTVGQGYVDSLVANYSYENTLVPEIAFLGNAAAVAFGDDRILLFQGNQKPQLAAEIPVKGDIQSVFYDEKHIGAVFRNEEGEEPYVLYVYNLKGEEVLAWKFSMEYERIKFQGNSVILLNKHECAIYDLKGLLKFQGTFEKTLLDILPTVIFNRWVVVTTVSTDKIKLN